MLSSEKRISKLSVYPEVGNFKDVVVGTAYYQKFKVKNLSSRSVSIRVTNPTLQQFTLTNYMPKKQISPGLNMVFSIEFFTGIERDFHDQISVICENEKMVIPLNAFLPRCQIVCPSSFDLGTVMPHSTTSKLFTMQNFGSLEGKFCFDFEDLPLHIIPKEGVLLPYSSQEIMVQYKSTDSVGIHQYTVVLNYGKDGKRKIEVLANVVECRIFLCHPNRGGSISEVKFERIYFGQKRKKKLVLTNTSGFKAKFSFGSRKDIYSDNVDAHHCLYCGHRHLTDEDCETARKKRQTNFIVVPKKGFIGPFKKKEVTVWFDPKQEKKVFGFRTGEKTTKAFEEDWNLIISNKHKTEITLSGSATKPLVSFSNTKLRFRNCAVNDYRDIMVELGNSNDLPAKIEFNRVAHFYARPSKCVLPPHGKKQITVTFHPNQLGFFANKIQCKIESGLKKVVVSVVGESDSVEKKTIMVGGVDKISKDFERPKKYVKSTSMAVGRRNPGEEGDETETINPQANMGMKILRYDRYAHHSVSIVKLQELQEKKRNQERFNNYVTTLRKQKEITNRMKMIERLNSNFMNDVDLGMMPTSGLVEPVPTIKLREGKLFLKSDTMLGAKVRKTREMDENVLIEKKFKPDPTVPNEKRECKIMLSKRQMQKVLTFPKTMDFGEMTVYAKLTKSFGVRNELKQVILVSLGSKTNVINVYPERQVIPPMSSAGFDVTICANEAQVVQQNLFFRVNDHNKVRLSVQAEVIPANVVLSRSEIKFRFNDYTLDPYIDETVTLTNKGNAISNFSFEEVNTKYHDLFELSPLNGQIDPMQTKQVHVIFKPSSTYKMTKVFKLKVPGALADRELRCVADLKEAKLRASEKIVNFEIRPVGMSVTKEIGLRNVGEEAVVFHVDVDSLHPDINVNPMKGKVTRKGKMPLVIELNPSEPTRYNSSLIIRVRAGRRIKLKVQGESRTPNVMIVDTPDTINFGKVFMGGVKREKISIKNVGEKIAAVLFLDLSENTDFTCEDEEGVLVTLENPSRYISVVPVFTEDEFLDDESIAEDAMSDQGDLLSDVGDFMEGLKFTIKIPPAETVSFNLVYKPTIAELNDFKLRLYLAGMEHESIGKRIISEGLQPKLVLSQNVVDFRSKVVVKQSMVPHRITISLTNEDKHDLEWWLGEKELNGTETFTVDVSKGRLRLGQSTPLIVFFLPSERKAYELKVPVYINARGWNPKVPYTHITFQGSGSFPKFNFSVEEVMMPVVPLGIESINELRILNDGYEKLNIRFKLPADKEKIPLEVKFPKGRVISRDIPEVTVVICFKSSKPTSFATKIDFYDDDGKEYSLPVSATADNCILTTFSFMMQHRDMFSLQTEGKNKPIMIVPNIPVEADLIGGGEEEDGGMASDGSGHKSSFMQENILPMNAAMSVYTCATSMSKFTSTARILRSEFSRRSIKRLLNWLNAVVMENPVDDLVRSLKQTRGGMLTDIIHMLSGKKIPLTVSLGGSMSSSSSQRGRLLSARKRRRYFKELLHFLKTFGGLLSSIKPEFFLSYEEFKMLNDEGDVKTKCSEIVFRYKNIQAWVCTLYQVIKLFSLKRISFGSFRSNPGVPKDVSGKIDKSLSMSNIMSVHENILLKWCSYHLRKAYPSNQKRVIGFGKDLSDSLVFAALLKNHIMALEALLSGINTDPIKPAEFENNARLIIASLKEAKIQYELSSQDIIQGNPRDLLLFCIFLYHILPQYLPKAKICFEGNLQENITRTVELFNPSKQTVEYMIQINYQSQKNYRKNDFQIPRDVVVLQPKSRVNFPFVVVPRFVEKSSARVTFFPKKVGSYRPDVIVFDLETKVFTDQVSEKFEVNSEIYQLGKIEIPVKNVFNKNGLFKITLEQSNSYQQYVSEQIKKIKRTVGSKKTHDSLVKELKERKFLPDPFWITRDHISVNSNTTKKLILNFLPFEHVVDYYLKIYFNDSNVGEFIYGVKGVCTVSNEIQQTSEFITEIQDPLKNEIKIRMINNSVERALVNLRERNKKYRHTVSNMEMSRYPDFGNPFNYKITFSNPKYFSGPKIIASKGDQQTMDILPFSFSTKIPGIYHCFVNLDSDIDKRRFQIKVTARSPGVKAELNFQVPVRRKVRQDIPIQNRSNEPWLIQATLKGDVRFSGPSEVHVPAKKTVMYPLTFHPFLRKDTTGELTLTNPSTMEKYIFEMKGKVDDPVAEGRLRIECLAREKTTIKIDVKKIAVEKSRLAKFRIECDLDFIQHPKVFAIEEGESKGVCKVVVVPNLGGKHIGSIAFISLENGEIIWYVLEVKANRSKADKVLHLKTVVRKEKVYEVMIENPVDREVEYSVQIDGDGLDGDETFKLKPREKRKYSLTYLPLSVGEDTGSLSIFHEDVGEFWYLLKLESDEPKAINVDEIRCEIGKEKTREIAVKCPPLVKEPIVLQVKSDKPRFFRLESDVIECAPFVTGYIRIRYSPSSFGKKETATLVVSHPSVGRWTYNLTGVGLRPTKVETIKIYAQEAQSSSVVVVFKNPFSEFKSFKILMTPRDRKKLSTSPTSPTSPTGSLAAPSTKRRRSSNNVPSGTFSLATINYRGDDRMMKKRKKKKRRGRKKKNSNNEQIFNLRPYQSTSIPITFTPPSVGEYKADITIELMEESSQASQHHHHHHHHHSSNRKRSTSNKSNISITNEPQPLQWKYVILGVTEVVNDDVRFHIRCKSRTSATKKIRVPLKGMSPKLGKSLQFSHELEIPKDQTFLKAIKRTVKVRRVYKDAPDRQSSQLALKKRRRAQFDSVEKPKPSRKSISKLSHLSRSQQQEEEEEEEEEEGEEGEESDDFDDDGSDEEEEYEGDDENDAKIRRRIRNERIYFLTFEVEFGPLRPFDGIVKLIVKSRKSGVWKFEIQLTSTPPDIDQTINIQAVIGKNKVQKFVLNNVFANNVRYEAYFTPESPIDFDIMPERGILAAKGVQGSEFLVSYKAVQYGKMAIGILVIDTEEMQWRYTVKGVLPKIRRINKDELYTELDNQLSPNIIKKLRRKKNQLRKKNFLKQNMEQIQIRERKMKMKKKKQRAKFLM